MTDRYSGVRCPMKLLPVVVVLIAVQSTRLVWPGRSVCILRFGGGRADAPVWPREFSEELVKIGHRHLEEVGVDNTDTLIRLAGSYVLWQRCVRRQSPVGEIEPLSP